MIDGSSTTVINALTIFAVLTSWWINGIEENYKQQLTKEVNELLTEIKKYTNECKEQNQELNF